MPGLEPAEPRLEPAQWLLFLILFLGRQIVRVLSAVVAAERPKDLKYIVKIIK
jgi:hypothetical protein